MAELLPASAGPLESEDSYSLTIVRGGGSIVLGRKAHGYGSGKLVLPGGKDRFYLGEYGIGLVPGRHNASREVFEETGLAIPPSALSEVGTLHIATEEDNKDVALYQATTERSKLCDSTELAEVAWHREDALPYSDMPADYSLWLPHVLSGSVVTAFLETLDERVVAGEIYRQQLSPLGRIEKLPVEV